VDRWEGEGFDRQTRRGAWVYLHRVNLFTPFTLVWQIFCLWGKYRRHSFPERRHKVRRHSFYDFDLVVKSTLPSRFDQDLIENSKRPIETYVKAGQFLCQFAHANGSTSC